LNHGGQINILSTSGRLQLGQVTLADAQRLRTSDHTISGSSFRFGVCVPSSVTSSPSFAESALTAVAAYSTPATGVANVHLNTKPPSRFSWL